jgi:hypothetical protein
MTFPYGKDLLYQEDFMKKKFLFGLIALLSVSFIFFGCGDSGGGSSPSAAEIAAGELADGLATLVVASGGEATDVVVSGTTVTVSASFTILSTSEAEPEIEPDVTLVLGENVTLTTEQDITVNGTVTLEDGASIVGDDDLKVIIGAGASVTGEVDNFYTDAGVKIATDIGPGTYKWDATLGGNTGGWKAAPLVIAAGAISGIVPVTGSEPATAANGTGYTGAVTWKKADEGNVGGNFEVGTVYVATITLTPEAGYTFTGTILSDFSVAGVDATYEDGDYTAGLILPEALADGKVIIKAIFPETVPTIIAAVAIEGVTPPVTGETPATTADGTGYTGVITWDTSTDDGSPVTFAAETVYVATITLSPTTGYTFAGFTGAFSVAGVDTNKTGDGYVAGLKQVVDTDDWKVTAWFPATGPTIIMAEDLTAATITAYDDDPDGIVVSAESLTVNVTTSIASGTIALTESTDVDQSSSFTGGDTQLITITLNAAAKHTFVGTDITAADIVAAVLDGDIFPEDTLGVPSGPAANPFVVTVTYTEPYVDIVAGAIEGVTPPVKEVGSVSAISGTGYTGVVTWATDGGEPLVGNFATETVYVATITLTPAKGYTFEDTVLSNFTVADVNESSLQQGFSNGLILPEEVEENGTVIIKAIFPETEGE